jgi:hypothetical protein
MSLAIALVIFTLAFLVVNKFGGGPFMTLTGAAAPSPHAKFIMQIVVSAVVGVAGLAIILSGKFDASAQKWAAEAIGNIVGFWLS